MIRSRCTVFAIFLAVLSILGLSLIGLQSVQAAPLVDPNARGSLQVTKHAGDPLTQYGDPSNPLANTNREPMPNIEFRAQRITSIDLTSNAGWEELRRANLIDFSASGERAAELADASVARTDTSGVATFGDLPVGAYYVTENPDSAQALGATVARPFIVTVPTTGTDGTAWNYNVAVNAKNQLLQVTQTSGTTCVGEDQEVRYGISATVPAPVNGTLERYELYLPLNEQITSAGESQVFITDGASTNNSPIMLVANAAEKLDAADFTTSFQDNVLHLALTPSGLEKLAKVRQGNPETRITWQPNVTSGATRAVETTAYLLPYGYPEFQANQTYGVASNKVRVPGCEEGEEVWDKIIPIPIPDPDLDSGTTPGSGTSDSADPTGTRGTTGPGKTSTPGTGGDGEAVLAKTPLERFHDALASTGANVWWVVFIGLAAIWLGLFMLRRRAQTKP